MKKNGFLTVMTATGFVLAGLIAAYAASSASWNVHPDEFDNGGGKSNSASFGLNCSIGGSVISGNAGGASFTNTSSFLPMLETKASGAAPDLQVAAGANNPADSNEGQGSTVPVLQVTLTAGQATDVALSSLSIHASGTGPDDTDVTSISIYVDSDGDGQVDSGSTPLATLTNPFSADDGTAVISLLRTIPSGATETWLVVYTFSASASGTFQASITPGDFGAAGPGGDPVTVSGNPVSGGTISVVTGGAGTLRVSIGPANLALGRRFGPGQEAPVLQVRLEASSLEAIGLTGLTLSATGTADDPVDVASLRLYIDLNADGLVSPADTLLQERALPFFTDNGRADFSFLSQNIPATDSLMLLVVAAFSADSEGAQTFGISIASASHLVATGAISALSPTVTGTPVGAMVSLEPAPAPAPPPTGAGGCAAIPAGGSPLALLWVVLGGLLLLRSRRRCM